MENKGLGTEWADYLQLQKDRPELFADNGSLHIMLDASVVADYVKRTGRTASLQQTDASSAQNPQSVPG